MSWHRNNIGLWSNGFLLSIEFVNIPAWIWLGDLDNALLSNRPEGTRGWNQKLSMTSDGVVPRWGLVCRGGRVTKWVFNGYVSWWKCTRPFGVVLSWILENKLPLGVGCSGRIARLMRWNETRTYWLRFGVWFVAAWPFQAEDFSPLAWGILNWTVKPCPFS